MTFDELRPLLRWRSETLPAVTPQVLSDSLTVEGLPYEKIPMQYLQLVVGIRHLRQDARLTICKKYLDSVRVLADPPGVYVPLALACSGCSYERLASLGRRVA